MEERTYNIHINIDDQTIPLSVKSQQEEEQYRLAAKRVQDLLLKYRAQFKDESVGGHGKIYLVLTAFELSLMNANLSVNTDTKPYEEFLQNMNQKLTAYLEEKE